jgi:hypothetical protein
LNRLGFACDPDETAFDPDETAWDPDGTALDSLGPAWTRMAILGKWLGGSVGPASGCFLCVGGFFDGRGIDDRWRIN